eukprot:1145346-Pelagomonas_calceolata.AAC.3
MAQRQHAVKSIDCCKLRVLSIPTNSVQLTVIGLGATSEGGSKAEELQIGQQGMKHCGHIRQVDSSTPFDMGTYMHKYPPVLQVVCMLLQQLSACCRAFALKWLSIMLCLSHLQQAFSIPSPYHLIDLQSVNVYKQGLESCRGPYENIEESQICAGEFIP